MDLSVAVNSLKQNKTNKFPLRYVYDTTNTPDGSVNSPVSFLHSCVQLRWYTILQPHKHDIDTLLINNTIATIYTTKRNCTSNSILLSVSKTIILSILRSSLQCESNFLSKY